MPRIPVSQRQVRQGVSRLPGSRVSAPLVGTRGRELQALSNTVGQVTTAITGIEKAQFDAEEIESDAVAQRMRDEANRSYHDSVSGFKTVKGKDASMSYDTFLSDFDDSIDKEVSTLGSESLKEKARLKVQRIKEGYKRQLDSHVYKELEAYDDNQTTTNLNSLTNDAKLNYLEFGVTDSKVNEALADQASIIQKFGERKGYSKEQIGELRLGKSSELHSAVIVQALNNGELLLAKDYYKRAKERKEIDGNTVARLDKVMHGSTVKGESQLQATEIMSRNLGLKGSLDAARDIKDPEVQDATVRRIKTRLNEEKLVRQENEKASFQSIINEMEATKQIDHLPQEELDALPEKKKKVMNKLMSYISKGHQPPTDPLVYSDLSVISSDPSLEAKFLETDINDFAHKLSTSDRHRFLAKQEALRKGKPDKDRKGLFSMNQRVSNALAGFGVSDKKQQAQFRYAVDQEVRNIQDKTGKELTPDETDDLITKMYMDVEVGGKVWDPDKKFYQVQPDEQVVNVDYDTIPERQKAQLREALQTMGIPFSEEAATQRYIEALSRGNKSAKIAQPKSIFNGDLLNGQ